MKKYQNKKIVLFLIFVLLMCVLISGCKKKHQKNENGENPVEITQEDLLSQEDAQALIKEKLEGTDCKFEFSELAVVEEENYYLFNIMEKGVYLEQMLAVSQENGEVLVYNDTDRTLEDYEEFKAYSPANDENIEWDGTYVMDDEVLVIDEEEPGSFSFHFYLPSFEEPISGYAYFENHTTGKGTYEDEELTFVLDGYKLTVTSSDPGTAFDGEFEKQ